MTLIQILGFGAFSLLARWLLPRPAQRWAWLIASLLAVFLLQPSSPIRNLDFWLPALTILLTLIVWLADLHQADNSPQLLGRADLGAALLATGVILLAVLMRFLPPSLCCLTATRPPALPQVLIFLALGAGFGWIFLRLSMRLRTTAAIFLLIGLFIVLKTPGLAQSASALLRGVQGQPANLASPQDLSWLGFSYLAFRLIHTLRDRQAGKLLAVSLPDFLTYALFYPAYTAGPIDRLPRFAKDLQIEDDTRRADTWAGMERLFTGVFKKFVLADSLALFALSAQNASQVTSTGWAWVLVYAYALRLYFDFSGYTDVAIGLGRLAGVNLPENFERPYLKTNLTAFWNAWHITLAQWFRAYFFFPVTRALRIRRVPPWLVILVGQMGTMLLIGLWHGITPNFALWGAWHGTGLYAHSRWQELLRPRLEGLEERPRLRSALQIGGWLLTFHYVVLGWVLFALPNPALALGVYRKLLGL